MSNVDYKEFLEYLSTWRSSREIKAHFALSNTSFYRMIRWCRKGGFVETYSCSGLEEGKTNRTYLYKTVKD